MALLTSITRILCAAFYMGAGLAHFMNPEFYLRIVPPYLPWHDAIVYVSGVAEIALGALLLAPRYSRLAAWGIIALLLAVFPANIYVYQNQHLIPGPPLVHLLRLPAQGLLILWAFWYTRPAGRDADATRDASQ